MSPFVIKIYLLLSYTIYEQALNDYPRALRAKRECTCHERLTLRYRAQAE